jgi:hemolysin III
VTAARRGTDRPAWQTSVVTETVLAPVVRPWLRGTFHRAAVPVAIALTALAAALARDGVARAAVVVYGVCVTAMFVTSGIYHARRLAHRPRTVLRRLDHSMILVGIAGTYTPVILLSLEGTTRLTMLTIAWALAIIGVVVRMTWMEAPSGVVALVYLVAGWQLMLAFPAYAAGLSGGELALLAVGGGLYTVGAVVYALKRPDPWPSIAGYHEVFHLLVIAAAAVQWAAVFLLAT